MSVPNYLISWELEIQCHFLFYLLIILSAIQGSGDAVTNNLNCFY